MAVPTLPVDGVTTINRALFQTYYDEIVLLQAGGTKMQLTVSQTGHGFAAKDVLRYGTGSFAKGRSNILDNCVDMVGVVASVTDANTFVLHLGGQITGLTGLVANTVYWLSESTPGLLTATRPTTGYHVPVLKTTNDPSIAYLLNMRALPAALPTLAISTKTGAYTLVDGDHIILADANSAGFTLTLPTAVGRAGLVFHVKKVDATANAVVIDGNGSETIDGATTRSITIQHETVSIVSDGANWHIL